MDTALANNYIKVLIKSLKSIKQNKLAKIVAIIYEAYLQNKQIFVMGNGGSAATASHLCCDLVKSTTSDDKMQLKVTSLNENTPLLTALSNDFGYESIFEEQLSRLLSAGDVAMFITASGNSPNILRAIKYAKRKGVKTVAFLGFDGGKANGLTNESIVIRNRNYGQIEDVHLALGHIVAQGLKERIRKGK
jgi:D-sedoheptulose 7-phosphate isomerase